MIRYRITSCFKMYSEYKKDGKIGRLNSCERPIETSATYESIQGLIDSIKNFFGDNEHTTYEFIYDEIVVSLIENENEEAPTTTEYEKWKKGECWLWLTEYFFQIQKIDILDFSEEDIDTTCGILEALKKKV